MARTRVARGWHVGVLWVSSRGYPYDDEWTCSATASGVSVLWPGAAIRLAAGAAVGPVHRVRRARENHARRDRAARRAPRDGARGGAGGDVGHCTGDRCRRGLRRGGHVGARGLATGSTGAVPDPFDPVADAEMTTLTIVVDHDAGRWSATVRELPSVAVAGNSYRQVIEAARSATRAIVGDDVVDILAGTPVPKT